MAASRALFSAAHRLPPLVSRQEGFYFDDVAPDSAWLREEGCLRLPPLEGAAELAIEGEYLAHPEARGCERGWPGLTVRVGDRAVTLSSPGRAGPWRLHVALPAAVARSGAEIRFRLERVGFTNGLAWLGRVTAGWPGAGGWQRFRRQNKNRQLRIRRVTVDGETAFDFSQRLAPYSLAFARPRLHLGFNIVGFLAADLGVGESARCMVRAADAAQLPAALVPLKLPCRNRLGDFTYRDRWSEANPYPINVIHLDPPVARDLDHHHGAAFRQGKYNIGYWAWELPEFPDAWLPAFGYFDEIWCPSEFTRAAISQKSPRPVLAMPHAIAFPRPAQTIAALRTRWGLPTDRLLFLFLYDLNSYSERKNPRAVIEAFRRSGLAGREAALVIKVQNAAGNEADLAALRQWVEDLPATTLITETLDRAEIYALEAACDCFVSLHRAEGFGLALAECMFLGKPVIATDWSATTEFVRSGNGCPVKASLVTITQHHGPYTKGQVWAEPDIDHAAWWMRRLAADPAERTALGAAARTTIETEFSPAVIGARYRTRLESILIW